MQTRKAQKFPTIILTRTRRYVYSSTLRDGPLARRYTKIRGKQCAHIRGARDTRSTYPYGIKSASSAARSNPPVRHEEEEARMQADKGIRVLFHGILCDVQRNMVSLAGRHTPVYYSLDLFFACMCGVGSFCDGSSHTRRPQSNPFADLFMLMGFSFTLPLLYRFARGIIGIYTAILFG